MENEQWEDHIGGTLGEILPHAAGSILCGGISLWLHLSHNGAAFFVDLLLAVVFMGLVIAIYRFFFVKVLIGRNGFFHRTRPGKGNYYTYSEISEAWLGSGKRQTSIIGYNCYYRTIDGQTRKFSFSLFESDAIEDFLSCINGEQNEQEEEEDMYDQ